MGVLTSSIHTEWARARSSTLRLGIRYTPSSAFETFPWPAAGDADVQSIGEAARRVLGRRSEICIERQIGLTGLYNQLEEGAWQDLESLHQALDASVLGAYGWSDLESSDSAAINQRLFELNARIVRGELEYEPRFA